MSITLRADVAGFGAIQIDGNDKLVINSDGTATVATPSAGDNSTKIATTAFVRGSSAAVTGGSSNLQVSSSGTSASVSVYADELVLKNSSDQYVIGRALSLTINTAGSGANGLDTGVLAINTWYSLWVIHNGTTFAGLISTSSTSPTLPSGYTFKARIGWVRTDGTANKYPLAFKQQGKKVRYVVTGAGGNVPQVPQAAWGYANGASSVWSSLGMSAFVPSSASVVSLGVHYYSLGNLHISLHPNQNASATYTGNGVNPPQVHLMFPEYYFCMFQYDMLLESTNIYHAYANTGYGGIMVLGWEDNL